MSLADGLQSLGILITVWLALVAYYRHSAGNQLERLISLLDDFEQETAGFWLSDAAPNDEQCQAACFRFTMKLERLATLVEHCRSKLSIPSDEHFNFLDAIEAATLDIEQRAVETNRQRQHRVAVIHQVSSHIISTMDGCYEKWPRKIFWW